MNVTNKSNVGGADTTLAELSSEVQEALKKLDSTLTDSSKLSEIKGNISFENGRIVVNKIRSILWTMVLSRFSFMAKDKQN